MNATKIRSDRISSSPIGLHALAPHPISRCQLCNCPFFQGNGQTCTGCGHPRGVH